MFALYNRNRPFCLIKFLTIATLSATLAAPSAFADFERKSKIGKILARPFLHLQEQIDEVSAAVDSLAGSVDVLTANTLPAVVEVDCAAGDSISAVLDEYPSGNAELTINVSGVCSDSVLIIRDRVTIRGVTPDAAIENTSELLGSIIVSRGASAVNVEDITLSGGAYGLIVTRNANVTVRNTEFTGSATGAITIHGGVLEITGSHLHDLTNSGLLAVRTSVINADSSIIENTANAVVATSNGTVALDDTTPDTDPSSGVTINNAAVGAVIQLGGHLVSSNVTYNPNSVGIYLVLGGSATVSRSSFNNSVIGVDARKNTSIQFGSGNTFTNNTFGVRCVPDTAYQAPQSGDPNVVPLPGTMVGNVFDIQNCEGF